MAFNDQQTRLLRAKLNAEHVKTRKANGMTLHYIEGWHAIAEANRIFGYDGWDRNTVASTCVWTGTYEHFYLATYTAKVRIRVRAGDVNIVREGSGTGEGKGPTPGQAHEIALKSAETDATKRALATFGNAFGLALYDREQAGVRQAHYGKAADPPPKPSGPWVLRSSTGASSRSFARAIDFISALREAMTRAATIEALFDIWEHNVTVVRSLKAHRERFGLHSEFAQRLVSHLKSCAVSLVKSSAGSEAKITNPETGERGKIDKSALTIGEPKRLRSKEHLRFVASQPCVMCGRLPSQAHHIRYAQPKGLGLKVSDEFVVPLCAIHHTENHATGNERRWWEERKIDPLQIASALWRQGRMPSSAGESVARMGAQIQSEEASQSTGTADGGNLAPGIHR